MDVWKRPEWCIFCEKADCPPWDEDCEAPDEDQDCVAVKTCLPEVWRVDLCFRSGTVYLEIKGPNVTVIKGSSLTSLNVCVEIQWEDGIFYPAAYLDRDDVENIYDAYEWGRPTTVWAEARCSAFNAQNQAFHRVKAALVPRESEGVPPSLLLEKVHES